MEIPEQIENYGLEKALGITLENRKINEALENLCDTVREIQIILDSGTFPEADLQALTGIQSLRNEFISAMQRIMSFAPLENNSAALPKVWSEPSNLARSSNIEETFGEALKRGIQDLKEFWEASACGHIDKDQQSEALDQLELHLVNAETAYTTLETYVQKHPAATNG